MQPITISNINFEAVKYCGTVPEEGLAQLQFLIDEGCTKQDEVLEIGCGALVAGIPIMHYLDNGRYTGLEPNRWLIDDTLSVPQNAAIKQVKYPNFYHGLNFNISAGGCWQRFDYIISHSVLTHTSLQQLDDFFSLCSWAGRPTVKVLFSCLLASKNQPETIDKYWHYPESVFISRQNLKFYIKEHGFRSITERPDMKESIMKTHPSSNHDWFILERK